MDLRDTAGRIYNEDYYTLLHTKFKGSGPCSFGDNVFFLCFSYSKSMETNNPRGVGPSMTLEI